MGELGAEAIQGWTLLESQKVPFTSRMGKLRPRASHFPASVLGATATMVANPDPGFGQGDACEVTAEPVLITNNRGPGMQGTEGRGTSLRAGLGVCAVVHSCVQVVGVQLCVAVCRCAGLTQVAGVCACTQSLCSWLPCL